MTNASSGSAYSDAGLICLSLANRNDKFYNNHVWVCALCVT